MKTLTLKSKGFTIIEVLVVLAIASLILLIVFQAMPQLSVARQDSQRRRDAGAYVAALGLYAADHNGEYPYTTNGVTAYDNDGTNAYKTCWDGTATGSSCKSCVDNSVYWRAGFTNPWDSASISANGQNPCGLPTSYFNLKGPGSTQVYFGTLPNSNGVNNKPGLGTYYYIQGGTCKANGKDWTGTPNSNPTSYALEWSLSNGYFCISG